MSSEKPPRWKTKVNTNSEDYQENYKAMSSLVEELHKRLEMSRNQGSQKHIDRHKKRGQLLGNLILLFLIHLARDRIELLLDEDSPFLELMPLAGWGQKNMTLGGSVVAGIGLVSGVECLIIASVPTLKGGAMNEVSLLKNSRLAEIAMENGLPTINLLQSGGADLTQQALVFHKGGGAFRNLALQSKKRLPTICCVFGSSTAGGAYLPGMSDYVIMVKNKAKVFLGGPPLVKVKNGEMETHRLDGHWRGSR